MNFMWLASNLLQSVLMRNENKATSKISSVDELELSNLSLFDRFVRKLKIFSEKPIAKI